MNYFNLRKQQPEPAPDEPEEEAPDAEEADEETVAEQPAKQYGPLFTGLLGPSRWLAARLGSSAAWAAHLVAVWAPIYYGGWAALLIPAGWLLAVLAFVPREHLDQLTARLERRDSKAGEGPVEDDEELPPSTPEEVYAATLEWMRSQIGDSNGIHLSDLLAHAHAHNLHTDLDVAAFRTVLEEWKFPIRQQLKVGGKNRPGIHRDDLPQQDATALSPEVAPVATTSVRYQL